MKLSANLFFLGLLAVSQSAFAVTSTASFSVSAVVLASCQVSAPAVAWRSGTTPEANGAPAVTIACDHPTQYSVTLAAGSSGTAGQKRTDPDPIAQTNELLIDSPQVINWLRSVHKAAMAEIAIGNRPEQPSIKIPKAETQGEAPGLRIDSITITVTY